MINGNSNSFERGSDYFESVDKDMNGNEAVVVSILNVVVDYVMSEPTPFEAEDYNWKLSREQIMKNEKSKSMNHFDDTCMDIGNGTGICEEGFLADVVVGDDDDDDRVQVPILRVFGPIVKGKQGITKTCENHDHCDSSNDSNVNNSNDNESHSSEFHQSGCLHIHGAFPYLLARPIQAGPDGSSFFFDNETKNFSSNAAGNGNHHEHVNIDWDDEESVSTILEDIHVQLEATLRSSIENITHGDDQPPSKSTNSIILNNKPIRFIRKITVVRGRGFYTYCIGTAAPFLRIEYYNPAHRWRVKVMLERGLEMPLCYHPQGHQRHKLRHSLHNNHHQLHRGGGIIGDDDYVYKNDNGSEMPLLKFRCYESHIPYTMQFFKVNSTESSFLFLISFKLFLLYHVP